MSIHGERLFGQVDRAPGLFYVSTLFFHFNFQRSFRCAPTSCETALTEANTLLASASL
jgi:hypothetical protein